jgi:hypothetical protein
MRVLLRLLMFTFVYTRFLGPIGLHNPTFSMHIVICHCAHKR